MSENPEKLEQYLDSHEAAGVSEVLHSPEGLYNLSASILEEEKAALEKKLEGRISTVKTQAMISALAVISFGAGEFSGRLQEHHQWLDMSLDFFQATGMSPLEAMFGSLGLMTYSGLLGDREHSKLEKVSAELRHARAKTSFSHGSE